MERLQVVTLRHGSLSVMRRPRIARRVGHYGICRRRVLYRCFSEALGARKIEVEGRTYLSDDWTNVPPSVLAAVTRRLHLQKDHPVSITRQLIESRFPGFRTYNSLFPIVSVEENFDSLGFPPDHPGRSRTDTYYVNKDTVLRTHTSAHEAEIFHANRSDGYLISADVYRRDSVDRTHYPVFHQMEGAYTWDSSTFTDTKQLEKKIWDDIATIPKHNLKVLDPNPPSHPERNPLQAEHHSAAQAEAMGAHLKRSLENVVVEIFSQAKKAQRAAGVETTGGPLQVRWVEAYFPWTSPSWELEVFWQGDWLEVLGCGIIKQDLLINSGVSSRSGWAFGLGLERIAMLLYSIPDIRLFWSKDTRFLSQFSSPFKYEPESTTASSIQSTNYTLRTFTPFSKYPAAPRDVAFWLPSTTNAAGGRITRVHENDVMEIVRELADDVVEDVGLVDEFTHPKTGRKSLCYRVNYRSLERTLTAEEVNRLHSKIGAELVERLGVELR